MLCSYNHTYKLERAGYALFSTTLYVYMYTQYSPCWLVAGRTLVEWSRIVDRAPHGDQLVLVVVVGCTCSQREYRGEGQDH